MERFGVHRSIDPPRALPQSAHRLDTSAPLAPDEFAVNVDRLNVDSASWRQIYEACGGSAAAMTARILEIVRASGKLHNPVTGSGGMLVGTVAELGAHRTEPKPGTRVATLVSLTWTPLVLESIEELDPSSPQVRVRGRAIVFGAGIYAEIPSDIPPGVALAVLDVCGAPAWMARLARPGMHVVVIGGGGKSGLLACTQAVDSVGDEGRVLALCWPPASLDAARATGAEAVPVDCTDPTAVFETVLGKWDGTLADLVFVCTNVAGCEGGAILSCDDEGRVVFFSMATSFTGAALTAEGLGKSCEMTIGNGFLPGHSDLALDLVRRHPRLLQEFAA